MKITANKSISIAMATYNGEKYLEEQFDSILHQTLPPNDMVICDDGSTDNTPQLIDKFAREASFPVNVIMKSENSGPAQSFATAIAATSGDWVCLADQDDVWRKDKLEVLITRTEPEVVVVFSNADLVDQSLNPIRMKLWRTLGFRRKGRLHHQQLMEELLRRNFVTGATMMFDGRFREEILPIPVGWHHDHWICCCLAFHGDFYAEKKSLILYRQHLNNVVGVQSAGDALQRTFAKIGDDYHHEISCLMHWINYASRQSNRQEDCAAITEKVLHIKNRAKLSRSFFQRLPVVLGDVFNGSYFKYSRGSKSIVKDLVFSRPHISSPKQIDSVKE